MLNQVTQKLIIDGTMVTSTDQVAFSTSPVYEVIRVMEGVPLFIQGHLERLFNSLDLAGLNHNITENELIRAISQLVQVTQIRNNNVRLEVGLNPSEKLTWVLYWVESVYPNETVYQQGVKTVTHAITRENPHAKIYRSAYAQKIAQVRENTKAFEVILVNEQGVVTEGSRSNLFFVKGDVIVSALEANVLKGITRNKLLALDSFHFEERNILANELATYDACFLTGTSIHILPISQIDDIEYKSSEHSIVQNLMHAFETEVLKDIEQTRRLFNDEST